ARFRASRGSLIRSATRSCDRPIGMRAPSEKLLVDASQGFGVRISAEALAHRCARRRAEAGTEYAVAADARKHRSKAGSIAGPDEQRGLAVGHHFGYTRKPRSDNRAARTQREQPRQRQPLP